MTTRRDCLASLIAVPLVTAAAGASTLGQVLKVGPKPKLIEGKPNKVDFGHGLLVPMSNDAFHTLWEGDDRWITYGHGFGPRTASAMGQAEESAIGTMKLYLLTLAFSPERLERIDGGGWRLKSSKIDDLVKGDIKLPGRPIMPTTDYFNSFAAGASMNLDDPGQSVHAVTGWLLWKKDVTLDYVRQNAQLTSM